MSVLLFWPESSTPTQQGVTWSPYAYVVGSVSRHIRGNLQFFDETAINPLPCGVFVSIYPALGPRNNTTLVGSGFIGVGGSVNIDLQPNTNYVAVFIGSQAPVVPVFFNSGNQ